MVTYPAGSRDEARWEPFCNHALPRALRPLAVLWPFLSAHARASLAIRAYRIIRAWSPVQYMRGSLPAHTRQPDASELGQDTEAFGKLA